MLVRELIDELKKCNPDDIVVCESEKDDVVVGVVDVLIGYGTLKGFTYIKGDKDDE